MGKMKCPGSDLEITIKECPRCGEEVELFTGESRAKCPGCGMWVPREIASCIEWCPGASECFRHVFESEEAAAEAAEGRKET